MKTKTYNAYNDPSHGWVKVHKQELIDLMIVTDISSYSYINGDYVFLEEDCDFAIFFEAMKKKGIEVKLNHHFSNRMSKIRSYKSFIFPLAFGFEK